MDAVFSSFSAATAVAAAVWRLIAAAAVRAVLARCAQDRLVMAATHDADLAALAQTRCAVDAAATRNAA